MISAELINTRKNLSNNSSSIDELDILQSALTCTDGFVWLWDIESDKIHVFGQAFESFNLGDDNDQRMLTAQSWLSRISPQHHESLRLEFIDLLKSRIPYLRQTTHIKNNLNQWIWFSSESRVYQKSNDGRAKTVVGFAQCINDVKNREKTLLEHEQQLTMAMFSTNSTLFDYDIINKTFNLVSFVSKDNKITRVNRQGNLRNGLTTVHPEDHDTNLAFFKSFEQKESAFTEAKWRSNYLNHQYRWQEAQGQIIEYDEKGNPIRAIGIRQDIHDMHLLELQAEAAQQRNYQALSGTLHGIWEWNVETDTFYINDNIKEKLIKNIKDWQPTMSFWWTFVHPNDKQRVSDDIQAQIEAGDNKLTTEYRIQSQDGQWSWVSSSGTVIKRDAHNKPLEVLGIVIDITVQKEAELALKEEKQLAQTTLESINEAVITTDAKGLITMLNLTAEKLLKTDKEAGIGKKLTQLCNISDDSSDNIHQDPVSLCLTSEMAFNLNQLTLVNHSQTTSYIDCSASPIHGINEQLNGCVIVLRDVTKSREMSREMEHRAQHDALTNLHNRHAFESTLDNSTATDEYQHILCYIDLDQFKVVNDTCGHIAGDELLRQLASELTTNVRKSDTLARLGGDEFGILFKDCDIDKAFKIATKIKTAIIDYTFHWEDKTFRLGASIGLSVINQQTSPTLAMQHADAACFSAKEQGRNRIHIYRPDDDEMTLTNGQMGWVPRLQNALQNDLFELHVQAIVDLQGDTKDVSHYEVLIRLNENGEIVPPGAFLPAAERYNLSSQLDKWIIKNTLHTLNSYQHKITSHDVFNINLSAPSLTENGFLEFIQTTFLTTGIQPSQICFEITETAAVTNLTAANHFIKTLKDMGCQFALDDFGSGLSSFGYLKNFPVDYLKIDGSFVKDIATDPIDAAMVKSINEIGQIMGKKTVAEWVESQTIADMLTTIGVNYAQGYHFSKPLLLKDTLEERQNIN